MLTGPHLSIPLLFITIYPIYASNPPCSKTINIYHENPTTGLVYSPNWPDPYPNRVSCRYNLSTIPSNVIHLIFSHFDLSPRSPRSRQCLDAYVLIIVIDRQGLQYIGDRICGGDQFERVFETMQSNIILEFVSNSNTVRTGFKIEYQFISEGSIRQPTSFYYDSDRTYEAACGGRNEAGSNWGEIISPGYPLSYPKNISCSWLIRVQPHQKIYARIIHLNISDIKECDFGMLSVANGYRHEPLISTRRDERRFDLSEAKFCGSLKLYEEEGMRSYITNSNRLLIRFKTGHRTPLRGSDEWKVGFKLIWTAINSIIDESPQSSIGGQTNTLQSIAEPTCGEFLCHGGLLCVEHGQGICSPKSQFCIDSSLVCNGVPNCAEGDFSDEFHCHSTEIFVSGAAALIVLLLVIGAALFCERARRKAALKKAVNGEQRRSQQPPQPLEAGRQEMPKNGRPVWEDRKVHRSVR